MDNNMATFNSFPLSDSELTHNGLPIVVADDDFIEYLREQGFETIELDELYLEYEDWAAENVL